MKKQKKENNLVKENEKMNRQMIELSDEMLEQVSGGQIGEIVLIDHDIQSAIPLVSEAEAKTGSSAR